MSKIKAQTPKVKKRKRSKLEGVDVRKAEGGFVVGENHDDYEDNKSHICTSKAAVTKLVNNLLG